MSKQPTKVSFLRGMGYIWRSICYMGEMRRRFLFGSLLASLELLMVYITPTLFREILDALERNRYDGVWKTLGVLMIVFTLLIPAIIIGNYWKRAGVLAAENSISIAVFDKIQLLRLKTLNGIEKGDYVMRLTSDTKRCVRVLGGYTFIALMKFLFYTVVSMMILLTTDLRYALVGLLMSLVSFAISFVFLPKVRYIEQRAKIMTAGISSMLIEAVSNAPVIRVFQLCYSLQETFAIRCQKISELRTCFKTANGVIESVVYLFGSCVQPVTFLMGMYLLVQGEMGLDTIVYLSGITGILADGIRSFSQFVQFVQSSFVSSARIYELIDLPVEKEIKHTTMTEVTDSMIHISDLHFQYNDVEIIKGINLDIKKKQKIAIVGKSGCGKSTLTKLIARLYEPTGGQIELADLHGAEDSAIAYVSQSCDVFKGTIEENIRYGKENATFAEIQNAAKKAGCQEFIESLKDGYDFVIDESGTNLSGGQKQRIAIARAFIRNAPILVLDEMTSAMDAFTEERIMSELMEEVEDKTVLMISHRVNVARKMERILVMENGCIVEDGNHEELMMRRGEYYRMYVEQG